MTTAMIDSLAHVERRHRARRSSRVIGLDVGARRAKCVLRETRGGSTRIAAAGSCGLGWDGIVTAKDLVARLEPLLRTCAPTRRLPLVCSLPLQMAEFETFDALDSETDSAQAAVQQYVESLLGPASQSVACDFVGSPLSTAGPAQTRFHLAWIDRTYAEQFAREMDRIGFECVAIDAVPAALARLGAGVPLSASSTLVVNIGADSVTFVSAIESSLSYVRRGIRLGQGSAVDRLADAMHLRPDVAATVLSDWGLDEHSAAGLPGMSEMLASHLSGWLQNLRGEIAKTISYLQQGGPANRVSRIVLCGGGAGIRHLEDWLQKSLGVPVEAAALPHAWQWTSAEPFGPMYAQALALTQHGEVG